MSNTDIEKAIDNLRSELKNLITREMDEIREDKAGKAKI